MNAITTLLLRCPRCRNTMKYQTASDMRGGLILAGKSKKCVYCNRSFKVSDHIVQQRPTGDFQAGFRPA